MSPPCVEATFPGSSLVTSSIAQTLSPRSAAENHRFGHLRGVRWRINLEILPSFSSSIDDLRRVTADSRRRYASLRRRLLVHLPKGSSNSPDLVVDDPLSQNPDSKWSRFFRNAELEKTLDQDLSRLYPEHGNYFQTPGCQGILRRVLLLWCLRHPEHGYKQGMHELLAPLLYVLHIDVEHLSQVRRLYEDHFADKFDDLAFEEKDITYNFELKKFPDSAEDEIASHGKVKKVSSLDELDPEIQTIVLLSDAYGAEGELGIVLSEKFIEHDAYCMFDALMSGVHGAVAMVDFFSPSPSASSQTGLPPVIEASSALYHLLSNVDSSLHSHLVELGVEPQYFALRWLRVLFGREFSLEGLLIIWDEIFASGNGKINEASENDVAAFGVLCSPRGAFISAIAVSMLLLLRSSLLATENATSCLRRLLSFPEDVNLKNLIGKAKSLQTIALDSHMLLPSASNIRTYEWNKSVIVRSQSLSSHATSPKTPLIYMPESYWEEKWRVLHKSEECKEDSLGNQTPPHKKGWSQKFRLSLSKADSNPSPEKVDCGKNNLRSSVRRSLLEDLSRKPGPEGNLEVRSGNAVSNEKGRRSSLEDLSRELGGEEDLEIRGSNEVSNEKGPLSVEAEVEGQDGLNKFSCTSDERCLSQNSGSEENSSIFSAPTSPHNALNDNDTEKSSVASNSTPYETDFEPSNAESLRAVNDDPLLVSDLPGSLSQQTNLRNDSMQKPATRLQEQKHPSGKFQWLWRFGRNAASEAASDKGGVPGAKKSTCGGLAANSTTDGFGNFSLNSKGEAVDQNMMITLKNLGQTMLENLQVIELALPQDQVLVGSRENLSKNALVGKGQVTAMAALKELRKISNLLSEM